MRLKDIKTREDLMAVGGIWYKRAHCLHVALGKCDDEARKVRMLKLFTYLMLKIRIIMDKATLIYPVSNFKSGGIVYNVEE